MGFSWTDYWGNKSNHVITSLAKKKSNDLISLPILKYLKGLYNLIGAVDKNGRFR